jgi:nucleotide-binding universal stress UspA family protein
MYVVNTRALQDLVKARIFLDVEEREYRRDIEGDADRYLRHVQKLGRQKGVEVNTVKTSGTVHTEVRTYIIQNKVDLLVLGGISQIHSLVVRENDTIWDMFETMPDMEAGGQK